MIYKASVTFHKDFIEINKDEISIGIIADRRKARPTKN
jgi:hypothetical protein